MFQDQTRFTISSILFSWGLCRNTGKVINPIFSTKQKRNKDSFGLAQYHFLVNQTPLMKELPADFKMHSLDIHFDHEIVYCLASGNVT